MKEIFPHTENASIVGITGAPGSGKSTLVDQLIFFLKESGNNLGVIAVDPSSPFSGGAILGDRIRMMRHSTDSGVFIRSMATRGQLGGLAKASGEAITILEAAGKNLILIETVGVGQDEVEVVKLADIILVVLTPGAGDDIQAFKAGIMEIADIFVLNKADSPEADKTERQVKAMLDLGMKGEKKPELIRTIATKGDGLDLLVEAIEREIKNRDQDLQIRRKKRLVTWMLKEIINSKIYKRVVENIPAAEFERLVERIHKREIDPYTVADDIVNKINEK
jgi:LAO/AO transport system kinase